MNQFNDLYPFIDRAVKDRKYALNTANGHKAALKLFEKELNAEEKGSLGSIEENIDPIYQNACRNNSNISSESLDTYRVRFLKVIKDYKKYGADPTRMKDWKPRIWASKPLSEKKDFSDKNEDTSLSTLSDTINSPVHKVELTLRPGKRFIVSVPNDITKNEAEILTNLINSLVVNKNEQDDPNNK